MLSRNVLSSIDPENQNPFSTNCKMLHESQKSTRLLRLFANKELLVFSNFWCSRVGLLCVCVCLAAMFTSFHRATMPTLPTFFGHILYSQKIEQPSQRVRKFISIMFTFHSPESGFPLRTFHTGPSTIYRTAEKCLSAFIHRSIRAIPQYPHLSLSQLDAPNQPTQSKWQ